MPSHKDKKKRVINKFKITELSAVDKPAQEGAKSVIMKRDESRAIMTLADESGHAHLLFEYGGIESGTTSHSGATSESGHHHPFVVKNGELIMGEANGHTHEIDTEDFNVMLFTDAIRENIERDLQMSENSEFKSAGFTKRDWPDDISMVDGSFPIQNSNDLKKAVIVFNQVTCDQDVAQHIARRARVLGLELNIKKQGDQISFDETASSGWQNLEIEDMPDTKIPAEETAEIQKQLDTVNAELAFAKAYAELTDAEKEHHKSLTKAKQDKFIAKSKEDRTAELEMLKAADPVVYTSQAGEVFHKSDDARLVAMAKRADDTEAQLTEQLESNLNIQLTKRAETELEFMPGTVETRVALLKAVETIEDDVAKQAVLDSLKAKNASMSKSFETIGTTEGEETGEVLEKSASLQKLDELAKAHAEKESVNYYTAYDIVAKANPKLYAVAVAG